MDDGKGFFWGQHAEAEKICLDLLHDFSQNNRTLQRFQERLIEQTSSRLLDWVDHLILPDSKRTRQALSEAGFRERQAPAPEAGQKSGHGAFYHPEALLPGIILAGASPGSGSGVAIRVESIAAFLQANGLRAGIEGRPLGPYRRALVAAEGDVSLLAVERRGTEGYDPVHPEGPPIQEYLRCEEMWQTRPRAGEEHEVFEEILRTAEHMVKRLGSGLAAHIVCRCERAYWLSRNLAGRVQQARQETLGLGWSNHDHYTFRSSRRNFSRLVMLFSRLGFLNRERFYAGGEAGWGAQIMEHPAAGLTLFLDVDLTAEEVGADFSREELQDRDQLGTVGLWCTLHGDSIFEAGLHHLAARYDFDRLIRDIALHGVQYMAPFSNFTYLKQAFSVAERWAVDPAKVEKLISGKAITSEQGERFLSQGSIGSHLENIERREGYKGFNKKNVSAIIRETDPRR